MYTDEEIISRYFSRDEGAIAATSQKYGRQCYSVSFNILRVQEDAEEFVNETYLKVWNAIPPERPHDLKYYLIKIVRNVSLNRLKLNRLKFLSSKKRSRELEISLSELDNVLPDASIPPEFSISDLTELINEFLDTLGRDERIIFVLRYWHFDSISDIAAEFGFGQSKVKTSLLRTREKLRKFLKEEGFDI